MKGLYFYVIFTMFLLIFSCQSNKKLNALTSENEDENSLIAYSPSIEKKIISSINKDAKTLKLKLEKESYNNQRVRFMIDTFKIVQFRNRKMKYMYSTLDMNVIVNDEMIQYDRLMNKYYRELYNKLDSLDKEILKNAQRAWLDFRDNEIELCRLLRDEKYSGGGTVQSNIFTGLKCDLTRQRMNELFEHSCIENDVN